MEAVEHPGAVEVVEPLARGPEAPGRARRLLGRFAAHLRPDRAQDAAVVLSELVTNAVRHGDDPLELRLQDQEGDGTACLRIEVADGAPSPPGTPPDAVPTDEPHGRGMLLVQVLAARWGWHRTPRGKVVWAEIAG